MTAAQIVRDSAGMVRQMRPEHVPGRWVFRSVRCEELPALVGHARAVFIEAEAPCAVLPAAPGDTDAMAQITLQVRSALDGVGLTAAVSGALARAGIACNVIAAVHHDHLFVPEGRVDEALQILRALSRHNEKGEPA